MKTDCQCDSSGYCNHLGREMHDAFWKLCSTDETYYKIFKKESDAGKYKSHVSNVHGRIPTIQKFVRRGIPQMGASLIQSGAEFLKNRALTQEGELRERLETCKTCEFLVEGKMSNRCIICGCSLNIKARAKTFRCPVGKWSGDEYPLSKNVKEWAVSITTAPRKEQYLEQTVESIQTAGWEHGQIIAEPGSKTLSGVNQFITNVNPFRLHPWSNFRLALIQSITNQPSADAYLVFQDDVKLSANAREYLEQALWPSDNPKQLASLYTPWKFSREELSVWYKHPQIQTTFGLLGVVLSPMAARIIARDQLTPRGARSDIKLGRLCEESGIEYWMRTPSLIQHIGEISSIHNMGFWRTRRAKYFCEDARELMDGT